MRRSFALLFALGFALAPAASGHGIVFSADPLQFNLDGYPAADKTVQLAPPAAGTVYFEAYQPGTAAKPIDFTLTAPIAFYPNGSDVHLALQVDKPVFGEDPTDSRCAEGSTAGGATARQRL